jgi:SAM-dependent methyltransferase
MKPRFDLSQVRRYYERHTPSFVRFGQGGGAGAIHRAVWGPGTLTRAEAFHYVEDRIADLIQCNRPAFRPAHVVDLGCGVGASLCYLAGRLAIHGTGITISPLQARLASARIAAEGLADRVWCFEGDYCDLQAGLGPADLAYAIESFVHGPSPERFFAQSGSLLRQGGLLVLCDDFRRPALGPEGERAVERYVRGWRINSLLEPAELRSVAAAAGFDHESTTELTPFLETRRPRDRAIGVMAATLGSLPLYNGRLGPMLGGSALQACLERGWIGYDLVVFRRR